MKITSRIYLQQLLLYKKRDIDRSTLYSFKGSFELLHADITDLNQNRLSTQNIIC